MAGVKGRSGRKPGSPPGPGRNRTSFRTVADDIAVEVKRFTAMFSDAVDIIVEDVEIRRCACGAISVASYRLLAYRHDALPEPDNEGNFYPLLGEMEMTGTKSQHSRKCTG